MTQPADDSTRPTRADTLKLHAHLAMQNFKLKQPDTYRHLVAHHMLMEAAIEDELGQKLTAHDLRVLRIGLKEGWIACQERLLELKRDQNAIDEFLKDVHLSSTTPPPPPEPKHFLCARCGHDVGNPPSRYCPACGLQTVE